MGWLSLKQLVKKSNISKLILKQTISVLIKHDIVIYHRIVKPIPNSKIYIYKKAYRGYPQNIIRILRIPRILNYTRDRFGDIAERLLIFLAFNGRSNIKNCVEAAMCDINIGNNNKLFKLKRKAYNKIMNELVKLFWVEKLPKYEFHRTQVKTQYKSTQFNSSPYIFTTTLEIENRINK